MGCVYLPTYKASNGTKRTSSIYWLKYRANGRPVYEPSGTDNKSEALKLLKLKEGDVVAGRPVIPRADKLTVAELAEMLMTDYKVNERKSLERAEISVKHLRAFFVNATALAVTTDRINAYIKARQEAKAKPATIRNELACLRRMFTLGVQAGRIAHRPHIPSIEVRNTRTGFFEESEFQAVLSHLPDEIKPVAAFAFYTGWRKSEILGLTWKQVDFPAGTVRLEPQTTKNDEGREFPFSVILALADVLRRQRERTTAVEKRTGRIIPWVFHRNGRPILDFRQSWETACDTAGVPGRLVHDFRRSAVRNLERAGVPRSVAMKLTGHKTEAIYRRYAIVSPADLKAGVERLARLHEAIQAKPQAQTPRVVRLKGVRG